MNNSAHPVAVLGAGPVGLAAAAHLVDEGLPVVVLESGADVASSVLDWGHVRLFSPWRYNIDAAAARLLSRTGWQAPQLDELPTGKKLVESYLRPLAESPELRGSILLRSRVLSVARSVDRVDHHRKDSPFMIRYLVDGEEYDLTASRVIDTTGTWRSPNPLGANGLPARGEAAVRDRLVSGVPDVLGSERARFAGRVTAVVGSGHSAANAVLALVELRRQVPATEVRWVVRGRSIRAFGGGGLDELPARGNLGSAARRAIEAGELLLHDAFPIDAIARADERLTLHSGSRSLSGIDQVIVATGQRPDHSIGSELRLDLDPALESARELGPLIDPNVHSCGTVRPHSYRQLMHADRGYFVAGAKSYGRAPTFLLATGYEQVRSIVAHLAGDEERAARVSLVLPETGVCSSGGDASCCRSSSPGATEAAKLAISAAPAACCG